MNVTGEGNMDEVAELRAAFIKSQLDRLMREGNPLKRKTAIGEFHRYFKWWGKTLSERDRREITKQLLKLDSDSLCWH
jgi:hypothetical protein